VIWAVLAALTLAAAGGDALADVNAASGEWCCAAARMPGFGVPSRATGLWPAECLWMDILFDHENQVSDPHRDSQVLSQLPPLCFAWQEMRQPGEDFLEAGRIRPFFHYKVRP